VSNATLSTADVSEATESQATVPGSVVSVHASLDPTILTCGVLLVWKCVPVTVKDVAEPDTAVIGLIAVTVRAGTVTAITTGVPVPSTAAAYVPPAVAEKQSWFPVEARPVAVVSNVTSNLATASINSMAWPAVVPGSVESVQTSLGPTILTNG